MNAFGDSRPTKAKQDRNCMIICSLSGMESKYHEPYWFYISTRIQNKLYQGLYVDEWQEIGPCPSKPTLLPGKSPRNLRKISGKRFPKKFPENSREKLVQKI